MKELENGKTDFHEILILGSFIFGSALQFWSKSDKNNRHCMMTQMCFDTYFGKYLSECKTFQMKVVETDKRHVI
jgi:hypothetical protein